MLSRIYGWLSEVAAHFERQNFVNRLELLRDRDLEDIGLRRDQLDALRLPPQKSPARKARFEPRKAARPSLQGCG